MNGGSVTEAMNSKKLALLAWGPLAAGALAVLVWFGVGSGMAPMTGDLRPDAVLMLRFNLVNQNGQKVSEEAFRGKPTAWFFGFTYCPDVCPTTLLALTQLLAELGDDVDRLNVVFVTVDPERDTPEVVKDYLSAFDPRITGLTGSRAEIDAVAQAFLVYQTKVPQSDGGYLMDHTALVMLTDSDFRFRGTLDIHEPEDVRRHKLLRLVGVENRGNSI